MKYAITPALTLTATVNPDFGQVEADPAVVNLSAFETFFPERRPFFVEGSGVFRFDMDCNDGSCTGLFYTRRIGRTPQLGADVPDNGFVCVAGQHDDHRRDESHRQDRRLLGWCPQCADRGRRSHRRGRVAAVDAADRAVRQLHGRPRRDGSSPTSRPLAS